MRSTPILASALVLAMAATSQAVAQQDPIIVGAAVAKSGFMVQYDTGPMIALRLAIEDINADGGILGRPLQLVEADTKTDPAGAARAGAEVLSQGASLVVTSCDFDFGGPAALQASTRKVIAFATCAADPKFGVQGIGPYAFTMATGTPGLAAVMAEWAFNNRGFRRPYILKDTIVEYTKSVCDHFKERWVELAGADDIVGEDTFLSLDPAIPAQISRIKALAEEPGFIFYCSGGPGGPAGVKQLRAAGIDTPILTTDAMDGDHWLGSVPDLSEFYFQAYGSIFGDDPTSRINAFVDRYTKTYGDKPFTSQVLTGYSILEAYKIAAERAGSLDSDAVLAELEKFDGEPLLAGPTTFSPDLHINLDRTSLILEVQNGQHRAIEHVTPEKVPAPRL